MMSVICSNSKPQAPLPPKKKRGRNGRIGEMRLLTCMAIHSTIISLLTYMFEKFQNQRFKKINLKYVYHKVF